MIAYITQYALTQGILKVEGTLEEQMQLIPGLPSDKKDIRFVWFDSKGKKHVSRMEGTNWCRAFETAKTRALALRNQKLNELIDDIRETAAMTFDSPVEVD